jgi:hypothetical protein
VPKYDVTIQVNYSGQITADSVAQAEDIAWTAYEGDDPALTYDSVEGIEVIEMEDEDDESEDD